MNIAERVRSKVKDKVDGELSKAKGKLAALGLGIGLIAAGALIALVALAFLLAAIGAAVATALPTWLALLVVGLGLLLLAGGLVLAGVTSVRKQR